MALTKQKRLDVVEKFKRTPADTGSTPVQVALLTERITYLSEHLKTHPKDYASQLGLLKLVGHRKRLLTYFKKTSFPEYQKLLKQTDLRK